MHKANLRLVSTSDIGTCQQILATITSFALSDQHSMHALKKKNERLDARMTVFHLLVSTVLVHHATTFSNNMDC